MRVIGYVTLVLAKAHSGAKDDDSDIFENLKHSVSLSLMLFALPVVSYASAWLVSVIPSKDHARQRKSGTDRHRGISFRSQQVPSPGSLPSAVSVWLVRTFFADCVIFFVSFQIRERVIQKLNSARQSKSLHDIISEDPLPSFGWVPKSLK